LEIASSHTVLRIPTLPVGTGGAGKDAPRNDG